MKLKFSNTPILIHINEVMSVSDRLAEAQLVVEAPEPEKFVDPNSGAPNHSLGWYFVWVEEVEKIYPAQVAQYLREQGLLLADATAGAALVRDYWHVLIHVLDGELEFALLGQIAQSGQAQCYTTIKLGAEHARVFGVQSAQDAFPKNLPVLVYKKP